VIGAAEIRWAQILAVRVGLG